MSEQRRLMLMRWLRHIPAVPLPVYAPGIGWWIARNDVCGHAMLTNAYEQRERRFVESLLRPGMTVLDIGAHHGLYTLLASRRVGPQGRVLAFEPSTRERDYLIKHVRFNGCRNVQVESVALGSESGWSELFVVENLETGCNCLRAPEVPQSLTRIPVFLETVDNSLHRRGIDRVDFIKLDVEGAELGVLKGAEQLLRRPDRPIILTEVEDLRTGVWGYAAREIVSFLRRYDYAWFRFTDTGLRLLENDCGTLNENLLAIPRAHEWLPRISAAKSLSERKC